MEATQLEKQFFIVLFFGVVGLVFFIFLPYLNSIVLAITFLLLFGPFYNSLLKAAPRQRGFAAFLTVGLVLITVLAPLTFFSLQIFREAGQLYSRLAENEGIGAAGNFLKLLEERLRAISPTLLFSIIAAEEIRKFFSRRKIVVSG